MVDDELAKAETDSVASRDQLARTVVALQSRLKPSVLAREAVDDLREFGGDIARSGLEAVKRNPWPTMGVVAVLTALLTRKPLARLLHRKSADTE